MKPSLIVFVDSDVIISSLISQNGAAYVLINNSQLKLFISDVSFRELKIVVKRLNLNEDKLEELINKKFKVIRLTQKLDIIKEKYAEFVMDINDSHIVAGAVGSKAKFLITYNLKHFKSDKIKLDFECLLMNPAEFLQYLRMY